MYYKLSQLQKATICNSEAMQLTRTCIRHYQEYLLNGWRRFQDLLKIVLYQGLRMNKEDKCLYLSLGQKVTKYHHNLRNIVETHFKKISLC